MAEKQSVDKFCFFLPLELSGYALGGICITYSIVVLIYCIFENIMSEISIFKIICAIFAAISIVVHILLLMGTKQRDPSKTRPAALMNDFIMCFFFFISIYSLVTDIGVNVVFVIIAFVVQVYVAICLTSLTKLFEDERKPVVKAPEEPSTSKATEREKIKVEDVKKYDTPVEDDMTSAYAAWDN